MSEISEFPKQIVNFIMNERKTKRKMMFKCENGKSSESIESEINFRHNLISLNPADFLPHGIEFTENNQNFVNEKLTMDPKFFLKLIKLILIICTFIIFSKILYDGLSGNSHDINGTFYNTFTTKSSRYENELKHVNEKLIELEKQAQIIEDKLEKSLVSRQILKTKVKYLKDKMFSFVATEMEKFMEKIDSTLNLYEADKVGQIDYALETAGGSVILTPNTTPYPNKFLNILGLKMAFSSDPSTLIKPDIFPGHCFAFEGHKGRIIIRLIRPIMVTSVTLDHPHIKIWVDRYSAPKEFKIHGYGTDNNSKNNRNELGHFIFLPGNRTFINFPIKLKKKCSYENVELEIINNHGHPNYTCVYRFRVHGIEDTFN